MADIATAPQPTKALISSPPNDEMNNQSDDPAATIGEQASKQATPEPAEPQKVVSPKPAFSWGKPSADISTNSSRNDANSATNTTSTAATLKAKKSLMDIMQEEEQISKAQQAQKEEDEFMKQAIQQSMALQQQEEDDLAMALRLSQLDAGIVEESLAILPNVTSTSNDESNVNLKQAPVANAAPQAAASAAASLPDTVSSTEAASASVSAASASGSASLPSAKATGLSEEEMASIQLAIQQAEDEELQKSLQLAMQLEMENETVRKKAEGANRQPQGNVRVISRDEYLLEQKGLLLKKDHGEDEEDYSYYRQQQQLAAAASHGGFRINAQDKNKINNNPAAGGWTRLDGFVVGPNDEIRTKHDPDLQGQANAHRLDLDQHYDNDEYGDQYYESATKIRVGNKAFNSFQQTMKKKTVKGVASHGQGRANTDTEKTKEGALDSRVRLLIGKTINQDWIDEFHGCVKEGKEALVYHATSGTTADVEMGIGQEAENVHGLVNVGDPEHVKYDVAVKVFKRIQEFRNRGQYVQGDPRYGRGDDFTHSSGRAQLEIWAEKEYRNLIRAYRVGLPVPQPLLQRENVLFLRFLGQDGWPCPQLREVKLKKKSPKWTALYQQTMESVQTLYHEARLVHGDLSEYNLLVCPSHLLLRQKKVVVEPTTTDKEKEEKEEENDSKIGEEETVPEDEQLDQKMPAITDVANTTTDNKQVTFSNNNSSKEESSSYDPNALQIALIDFGQAVDTRHPEATELLKRDLLRVKQFFDKMAIRTLSLEEAMTYVTTTTTKGGGAPLTTAI